MSALRERRARSPITTLGLGMRFWGFPAMLWPQRNRYL